MSKFEKNTLENLCLLVTDGTHYSPKLRSEGIPFIKPKHIAQGFVNFDICDYITYEDHLKVIAKSKPEKGDTLFSHIGASLGLAAYVNSNTEFSIKNLALFKPDLKKIVSRYLYYSIINNYFQETIKNKRSGSAQAFVALDTLRKHKVVYHANLISQKKIATILSAYDDLIENNNCRIQILDQLARLIYQEWFVKFNFPGHDKVNFKDSQLGKIPDAWKVVKLSDIVDEVRRGIKPEKVPPDTPYFGLEHFPQKSIALSNWGFANRIKSNKLLFKKNEILFGKIRPYLHKVGAPPVQGICSTDVIVIKPKDYRYFPLALACVSDETFVAHANATSQGTQMPRVDWKVLQKYQIILPSERILQLFNDIITNSLEEMHNFIFRNNNLRQTRDLLLPKLISGELDVEDLDITIDK